MKVRRVWAIAHKEFLHIFRDPTSLGLAIGLPVILIILFGSALTLDVDNVPMIIWDQDSTPQSRALISYFAGSRYFQIRSYVDHYDKVDAAINARDAVIALIIPNGFAEQVVAGRSISVQMILDGSDANTAMIAAGYAEVVVLGYSQQIILEASQHLGGTSNRLDLDARLRIWFNADLQSKNYIIPGLISVIMMIVAAMLTSLPIAREWEQGTMEQLISTPIRGRELILGKLIPYFVIGMIDVAISVFMGEFLFHVPLRGSAALLFAMSTIFLAGALAIGLVVSIVAKKQLLANQMAMVCTFTPSFMLSGFMFSVPNMPEPLQIISHAIPARHFIDLLRAIYLKGVGLEIIAINALFLGIFAVVVIFLANLLFHKKLR